MLQIQDNYLKQIYTKDMPGVIPGYKVKTSTSSKDIPKICQIYAKYNPKIFQRYAKYTLKINQRYAKDTHQI